MEVKFVDLHAQYLSIKDEIDAAIQNIVEKTAFVGGEAVAKFEHEFAEFIGIPHCISCGNGTDALQIALKAFGIGPGDEVIIPAYSFIATSEAVTVIGAQAVFCDVERSAGTINVYKIEPLINERTKAIIPVHLYGRPADLATIMAIAKNRNLKVIEDAAQAHGAQYHGKNVGTFGHAACFSFYPGKNLGAYGDGGAIVTADENAARFMKMYANHGRITKYNHEFEGTNSRLDGIQAAVLSVKLKHLSRWNEVRRQIAFAYNDLFARIGDIETPLKEEDRYSVYHLYVIKTQRRDELLQYLKENDICAGVHYPIGLPFLEAYRHLKHTPEDFPVTYELQSQNLSLPLYPEMEFEKVIRVAEKIRGFYGRRRMMEKIVPEKAGQEITAMIKVA